MPLARGTNRASWARFIMPEGPEVRRYAQQLAQVLDGGEILHFSARTKAAKAWLLQHVTELTGQKIFEIRSHGKHLYGRIEGDYGFHSHLMMWGRWFVHPGNTVVETDKRERARIATNDAIAVLFSAPIFDVFAGDPYEKIENLATLGPDIIPYNDAFDAAEFNRRLLEHPEREIGAALLDQRICAGIGNYIRAEVLFFCGINPFTLIRDLTDTNLDCLNQQIPLVGQRALAQPGVSVPDEMRARLLNENALSYGDEIREFAARHAVFRRTNLPCLNCGGKIRQKRQVTLKSEDENEKDKSRIIYFCPHCQSVR